MYMMYVVASSDVMLSKQASVTDFARVVGRNKIRRKGRMMTSGSAVKINVYCAFVVVSLLRSLVMRVSCSVGIHVCEYSMVFPVERIVIS